MSSNSEQFLQRAEERFKNLQVDTTTELDKRKVAIENLIAPLDKSLKSLDSKVADLEAKRIEAYAEVKTQISELGSVNRELRNQTGSLVQALRSPNVRGDWGQMQLRRTVEMAGMLGHCDFFEQVSEASESGRLTPDMIVRLPGDRRVVVDAKAPRMYLEGLADRTEAEKSQYLRDHAAKVRAHMTLLVGQTVLGAIRSNAGVRHHVPARRGTIRGGAAGRSGPAGIRRRQESDSRQPADADRAAASRELRMEAGVARARCVENS